MSEQDLPKIEVKIACVFPNLSTYTLPLSSKNKKTGQWETLLEDGSIIERTLTQIDEREGKRMAKITLAQEEFVEIPDVINPAIKQRAIRCYTRLSYVPEKHEHQIANLDTQAQNKLMRGKHEFLVKHMNAEIQNMRGVNINTNLQTPLVIVIDETNDVRAKKEENELITKCREIVNALYKTDEKGFVDMCYALNIPNIHLSTIESLFNKVNEVVMSNPIQFNSVYDSNLKSMRAMVNRAIYMPLSNGETALEIKNGYYNLDGLALVKQKPNKEESLSDLIDYFVANPESLKRLEQIMGIFIPRTTPQKLAEPVEVSPTIKDPASKARTIQEQQRYEAEVKQKIVNMVTHLKSKSALDNKDWENYTDKIKALKSEHPSLEKFIDIQSNSLCEAKKLVNPFKTLLTTN